jgi:hypothetical protein
MDPIEGSKISRSNPVDRGFESFELFGIRSWRKRIGRELLYGSDNFFFEIFGMRSRSSTAEEVS